MCLTHVVLLHPSSIHRPLSQRAAEEPHHRRHSNRERLAAQYWPSARRLASPYGWSRRAVCGLVRFIAPEHGAKAPGVCVGMPENSKEGGSGRSARSEPCPSVGDPFAWACACACVDVQGRFQVEGCGIRYARNMFAYTTDFETRASVLTSIDAT